MLRLLLSLEHRARLQRALDRRHQVQVSAPTGLRDRRDLAAIECVWNEMQQTRPETITSPHDVSLFTWRTWGKINLGMMWGRLPDAMRNITQHPRY